MSQALDCTDFGRLWETTVHDRALSSLSEQVRSRSVMERQVGSDLAFAKSVVEKGWH